MRRTVALGFFLLLAAVAPAMAQLPIQIGFNAGTAMPIRNEKDIYNSGFHLGASAKIILIPVQLDAAIDHMGGKTVAALNPSGKDLNITSVGVIVPVSLTPSLLPVSVYVLGGAGLYHHSNVDPANTAQGLTKTDTGINAGAGVRFGIPGIKVFAEGRGVAVMQKDNKLTYLTAAVGIRF